MKLSITPILALAAAILLLSPTAYGQYGGTSVMWNGSIYSFGGQYSIFSAPVLSNDMVVFDPLTGKTDYFQRFDPWPEPRFGHSASTMGDKMYIFGGENAKGEYLNDVWEFDFKTKRWKKWELLNSPVNRRNHVQVTMGNSIYVAGGSTPTGASLDDVYALDLTNPTSWTKKAPLIEPLQSSGAFWYNNIVYLYGGFNNDYAPDIPGNQRSVNRYVMQYTPSTNQWAMLFGQDDRELYGFAYTTDNNGNFWVSGGCSWNYETDKPVFENGIALWEQATGAWTNPVAANDLFTVSGGTLVFTPGPGMKTTGKGKLYLIGGRQADGTITGRIVEYDIETKTFKVVYTPSGIEAPANPGFAIAISPNPANSLATISLTLSKQNVISISVYDLSGRMVLNGPPSKEYTPGTHTLNLDISGLAEGMYNIRVATTEQVETGKLLVGGH
jgi:N-acetylneuraminic acid mutarotase